MMTCCRLRGLLSEPLKLLQLVYMDYCCGTDLKIKVAIYILLIIELVDYVLYLYLAS